MLRLGFGMFKTKLKSQKYGSAWGRLRPLPAADQGSKKEWQ
jgi:hypothetical protein